MLSQYYTNVFVIIIIISIRFIKLDGKFENGIICNIIMLPYFNIIKYELVVRSCTHPVTKFMLYNKFDKLGTYYFTT